MPPVNIEENLAAWARGNPFLTDKLLVDFLDGNDGNCSITTVSHSVLKTYIDGTAIKEYAFAMQVMFAVSNDSDDKNTDNMFTLRKWQAWIAEQERARNYPDFGDKCSGFRLENLTSGPGMAMRYENGMAKYQFFAKITYRERI